MENDGKLLKTFFIDVTGKGNASVVVIKNELNEFYRLLNCKYVETHKAVIGEKTFTVICDEDARMHPGRYPSVIDSFNNPILINNVLICNSEHDDFSSLNNEDIALIKKQIISGHTIDENKNIKKLEVLILYN